MSNGWGGGGGGGAMPPEPWQFACGFRVMVGNLRDLNEKEVKILLCGVGQEEVMVGFKVNKATALIGLNPVGMDSKGNPIYQKGDLVQVNLYAASNVAISIERYFSGLTTRTSATGS